MIRNIQASKRVSGSKLAWWRAGEIYDRRLRNPEAAKNAYAKVPTSSRNYKEAQKRLK